ncbi:syncytin-2-like [Ambystoma mexicanum]|uniref:syncytin-2-like n=1 Tax=Ambystoma mexicanum TaxID=8296 RepID=UPI0037E83579
MTKCARIHEAVMHIHQKAAALVSGQWHVPVSTNGNVSRMIHIANLAGGGAALLDIFGLEDCTPTGSCSSLTRCVQFHYLTCARPYHSGGKFDPGPPDVQCRICTPLSAVPLVTPLSPYKDISMTMSDHGKEGLLRRTKQFNYNSAASSKALMNISEQYHLFSGTETFFLSLLAPVVQAATTAEWLQVSWYEHLLFVNLSTSAFSAIKKELWTLSLITLQKRYILDLLTAMEGAVCQKIGSKCCMFVPPNDSVNGSLTQTVAALHKLRVLMENEAGIPNEPW